MQDQESQSTIRLIPHNYLVSDLNIFNKQHLCSVVYVLIIISVINKIVGTRGKNSHWFHPLIVCVFNIIIFGDILMFVRYCFSMVGQRGTMSHLVNPMQFFRQNYFNVFKLIYVKKYGCYNKINTKVHYCLLLSGMLTNIVTLFIIFV